MSNFNADAEHKLAVESTAKDCLMAVPCGHEWCPCTDPEFLADTHKVNAWCMHHKIASDIRLVLEGSHDICGCGGKPHTTTDCLSLNY